MCYETNSSVFRIRKLFYKFLCHLFVRRKHKCKNLYICLARFGLFKYLKLEKLSKEEADSHKAFKYFASIACIVKNEGPFLREWIEYHRLIGVEHFYIYDNDSTDNTKEVLAPYIDDGTVTYIYFPGKDKQDPAYCHAVEHFKNETRWLAIVDLDEFIVLHQKRNLREFMEEFQNCSQLSMHWVLYGSSGHIKQPEGLILENFKSHADSPTFSPKSIFNPRTCADCGAHYMYVCGDWVNENHQEFGATAEVPVKKCQVNHYIVKSKDYFYQRKVKRGWANATAVMENVDASFKLFDRNEVTDELMEPYVTELKRRGVGS